MKNDIRFIETKAASGETNRGLHTLTGWEMTFTANGTLIG